jgi:hypothetical protein
MTILLDSGRQVFKKLLEAKMAVNTLTFKETTRIGDEFRKKLSLPIQEGQGPPTIRILSGNQNVGYVYPANFWVSRKSLRDYITAQVNRSYPNMDWTVEILLDGHPHGGFPDVEEFVAKVMAFYGGQQQAKEFRKSSEELRALGSKLLLRIDQELG